jgi:hypothetical protein
VEEGTEKENLQKLDNQIYPRQAFCGDQRGAESQRLFEKAD